MRQTKQLRERDIEAYLKKRVEQIGGEVRKVKWLDRRGAPDRFVMLPERVVAERFEGERNIRHVRPRCGFWVELKAPGGVPEPHQLREHGRMRKYGQIVVVIDSIEGVEELMA